MMMRIASAVLAEMCEAARQSPNREICGLLFGDDDRIRAFRPAANVSPEPASAFEIDPAALIAAHRESREGGPRIIGHYHSHPCGPALPSARDAAHAWDIGTLWLILAADGDHALFQAVPDGPFHGAFVAVDLLPD